MSSQTREGLELQITSNQVDSTGTVSRPDASDDGLRAGSEAVDFVASAKQGKLVRLSQFKGQFILLNFWATWCPPCVEEMPSLLSFSKIAKKQFGVEVLAVSSDENWGLIESQFQEKKWDQNSGLQVLLDTSAESAKTYGVLKYPETFLIDKNFKVVKKFVGVQDWMSADFHRWLKENLK